MELFFAVVVIGQAVNRYGLLYAWCIFYRYIVHPFKARKIKSVT